MILKYSAAATVLLAAIVLALSWQAPDAAKTSEAMARRVLKAVQAEDYAAFVALADKSVRRMRSEDFRALAGRHAPRLRAGHALHPLEQRWRANVHVSRWRVTFNDGGPDAIVILGLREGKVATFAMY